MPMLAETSDMKKAPTLGEVCGAFGWNADLAIGAPLI
jgi:hypothetical protein